VTLLRDRYVTRHKNAVGVLCTFTRAPYAVAKPVVVPKLSAHEKTRLRAARESFTRNKSDQQKAAEAAKKKDHAERAASGLKKPKRPRRVKVVCDACHQVVSASGPTAIAAHQGPSGHWCRGGAKPKAQQRKTADEGRSVWTVSGGLPGHGKRR